MRKFKSIHSQIYRVWTRYAPTPLPFQGGMNNIFEGDKGLEPGVIQPIFSLVLLIQSTLLDFHKNAFCKTRHIIDFEMISKIMSSDGEFITVQFGFITAQQRQQETT